MIETDLDLGGGRTLHAYDTGADETGDPDGQLAVFWHHGSPNIGAPPEPVFETAARLGIRWVAYDRPGYGGSSPRPGRNMASAATDVSSVADALGIGRSRSWATPGVLPTHLPAPRSCRTVSWARSSWRDWRPSAPRASTGTPACATPATRRCARPPRDAQQRRRTSPRARSTTRSSPRRISPHSRATGPG